MYFILKHTEKGKITGPCKERVKAQFDSRLRDGNVVRGHLVAIYLDIRLHIRFLGEFSMFIG